MKIPFTVVQILSALIFMFAPPSIAAQEKSFLMYGGTAAHLAAVHRVYVGVNDSARDKCFTNSSAVKNAVELAFRRNGFEIVEKKEAVYDARFELSVAGLGVKMGTNQVGCSVNVGAALEGWVVISVPYIHERGIVPFTYNLSSTVILQDQGKVGTRIRELALERAEEAANLILSSRSRLKSEFPDQYQKLKSEVGFTN